MSTSFLILAAILPLQIGGESQTLLELEAVQLAPELGKTLAPYIDHNGDGVSDYSFWAVRKAAMEVLQSLSSEGQDELYIALLADVSSKVRVAALAALLNTANPIHLDLFRERFDKDDSYLAQAQALRAIGKIGNLEDPDLLDRASNMASPHGVLKRAAKQAIAEIRAR